MSNQTGRSIRAQLMWLSLIIVTVSVALSLAGTLYITLRTERKTLDQNLLNSASILSQVPLVREALLGEVPADELADFLDAATARTSDIDLILVGDTESVLRYAPDRSFIGSRYTGSAQTSALAGAEPYTFDDSGPMGSDHSAYAGLALLLACTIPTFFIKKGAWLQHRAQTLALWIMFVMTVPQFADVLAPIPTTHNPTAFFAVSFLALASNVALAAYQFRKIRKLKLNPLKDELYADTKSYQELEEANR